MTGFDRLHPSLQHHVVNSLGWRELRPLQDEAIAPVLDGLNCLLLAPTAGGKTEAAVLPVLSKIMQEDWRGLSVLYVCPIRALLNNLNDRLTFYTGLVGRSCGLWHGDVAQAVKSRILDEPPDLLLTTPESLEALLVSRRTDRPCFFGHLKAVIVDEIHAFAGDDRGWHLLAVIERIRKLADADVQRIGLSATVGNPERLLTWLCGSSERRRTVIAPAASQAAADAEVTLDYVGSLANAAHVLRVLHHGEKRLVFCDSRSRTEELATHLRAEGVLDVFSRYVAGWMVAPREGAELAKQFIEETIGKHQVPAGQLTIHADRGKVMTSKPVAFLMADLGVTKTHSRPYVSDDNPYSESQFRTMKYRPEFPDRFGCIQDSRAFCQQFFQWYNQEHRHSGIGLLTPAMVHFGETQTVLAQRQVVLDAAYQAHPDRFVRRPPKPQALPAEVWINRPVPPDLKTEEGSQ